MYVHTYKYSTYILWDLHGKKQRMSPTLSLGDEKCKAQLLEKCTPGRDYFNDVFLDKMRE